MQVDIDVEKIRRLAKEAKSHLSGFIPTSGHNPLNWAADKIDQILSLLPKPCQAPTVGKTEEIVKEIEEQFDNFDPPEKKIIKKLCSLLTDQAQQYDKGWQDGSDAQDEADHKHIIEPLQTKIERLEGENAGLETGLHRAEEMLNEYRQQIAQLEEVIKTAISQHHRVDSSTILDGLTREYQALQKGE